MAQYLRLLTLLLVPFLCTCGPGPEKLFRVRTGTGVNSTNQLRETEEFNIVEYLYYYNGGGVAATDINGDGLADLYFTNNQGPNKYYINEGDFRFRDATDEGGVAGAGEWTTGVSVVDVDGNGLMDIYVCNVSGYKGLSGRNELFLQNADGTFTESAADYGLDFAGFNTQAYWFDYDLDGDLDMYLLRHSVHNDATYGTAESRNIPDSLAGDLLLRNNINLLNERSEQSHPSRAVAQSNINTRLSSIVYPFTNVTASANLYSSKIGYGLSATVADFDQNGYPDLYVCNDFSENDYYYLNQGDGTFRESVRELTGHTSNFSMGSDAGDFDGDGWPDLFSLDMRPWDESILKATMSADQPNVYNLKRELGYHDQLPHNALQWNRGGGNFSEIAEMAGVAATDWSWSCLIEDFDLDGEPDIFVANGIERRPNSLDYLKFISSRLARTAPNLEVIANMPDGRVANRAFRKTGDWVFEETSGEWGLDLVGSSTGAAVADFDNDGDPDLVLNNLNAPATIYENTAADDVPPEDRPADRPNRSPLAAQRGMMSQSGPATISLPGASGTSGKWYSVKASGIIREGTRDNYFDAEPLALYARPAEDYPVLRFDGGIAIRTGEGMDFQTYNWENGVLKAGEKMAMPALQNQYPNLELPDKPLKTTFAEARYTVEAAPFSSPRVWRGGDNYLPIDLPAGLWQSVAHVSGEGEDDSRIIVGNWGLNSTLGQPTAEEPLRLYAEDVDGNGKVETLFTYVRGGREMTVADKDELSSQLPGMRRNNLSYADFANRSFAENFPGVTVSPQTVQTLSHYALTRTNGGSWIPEELPRAAQVTSVNCALEIPAGILLGGNTLEVLPRIGRQDAAALQLLKPDGSVELIDLGGGLNRLEIRQLLRLDARHVLVVVAEGEHQVLGW